MNRTNAFTMLNNGTLTAIREGYGNFVEFLNEKNKIVFTVDRDDLFDKHGNRFDWANTEILKK